MRREEMRREEKKEKRKKPVFKIDKAATHSDLLFNRYIDR
jgi:hypothetical protein